MDTRYPVRNPDIVSRIEAGEALLFNPSDGNMLCMNETGIFVWQMCDGTRSGADIVEAVTSGYDVGDEDAEKDYRSFIAELERSGFIGYRS